MEVMLSTIGFSNTSLVFRCFCGYAARKRIGNSVKDRNSTHYCNSDEISMGMRMPATDFYREGKKK